MLRKQLLVALLISFVGALSLTDAINAQRPSAQRPGAQRSKAQRPFEKFQKRMRDSLPKGDLLKKLRENISGDDKKEQDKKPSPTRTAQETSKSYQQQRYRQTQSTESQTNRSRPSNYRVPSNSGRSAPTLKAAPNQRIAPAKQPEVAPRYQYPNPASQSRKVVQPQSQKIKNDYAYKAPSPKFDPDFDPRKAAKEFANRGVLIRKSTVKGFLYDAGIRTNDRVVGIGGIPVNEQIEIDEIVGVLGQGDQIEIVIVRGGKMRQLIATNGQIPEADVEAPPIERKIAGTRADVFDPQPSRPRPSTSLRDPISPTTNQPSRSAPSNSKTNTREVDQMRRMIQLQRSQIQQLQNEIQKLRRQLNRSTSRTRRSG